MGQELGIDGPRAISREREYELARAMVARGARAIDLARKLSVPYRKALRLYERAHREVFEEAPTRMDPEADAALKDDLTETLIRVVARCDELVERSFEQGEGKVRAYDKLLAAAARLARMRGYDAPTRSVNVEWKAHALVNPEVQARIMADPGAREAFLALEEFAASQPPPEGGDG